MSERGPSPFVLKTTGYLISTFSIMALGVAAWPGAEEAGLAPWLVLGMVASTAGMACRWTSYLLDKQRAEREARASHPGSPPVAGPV